MPGWFAFQRAACFAATVLARDKWPICASLRPLGVYIYAFGSQSCATRLIFAGSAPLAAAKQAALGTLGSSARCSGPPLPSSSRRYAPQCFVGEYTSSPCDVSHRASDEPRHRMSLSSALVPSSLASPSIRRVFLRSFCARRRPVSSLNLARVPRSEAESPKASSMRGANLPCHLGRGASPRRPLPRQIRRVEPTRLDYHSKLPQVRQAKLGRTNSGRSYIVKKSTYD